MNSIFLTDVSLPKLFSSSFFLPRVRSQPFVFIKWPIYFSLRFKCFLVFSRLTKLHLTWQRGKGNSRAVVEVCWEREMLVFCGRRCVACAKVLCDGGCEGLIRSVRLLRKTALNGYFCPMSPVVGFCHDSGEPLYLIKVTGKACSENFPWNHDENHQACCWTCLLLLNAYYFVWYSAVTSVRLYFNVKWHLLVVFF